MGEIVRVSSDQSAPPSTTAESCGESHVCCCPPTQQPPGLGRRSFIKVAGVGLVGAVAEPLQTIMAGSFSTDDLQHGLLIPAEKKLDKEWVRSLFERGAKEVYRGECLENIGMPCGGIGAGQLYLRGDGTLGLWKIFNGGKDGWGEAAHTIYRDRGFDSPVKQGFALECFPPTGNPRCAPCRLMVFQTSLFRANTRSQRFATRMTPFPSR